MLEAYLDESGTHAGAKMLCVAAYIGNRKQWYAFDKEWYKKLQEANISCFHAVEHKCHSLKFALMSAIERYDLTGFIVSVRPGIFNLHAGEQFKSKLGNAYSACALGCAMEICKFAKINKLGPVSIILEMGQPNIEYVQHVLEVLAAEKIPSYQISAVSLAKKDESRPLQTADFLAHTYSTQDQPWLKSFALSRKLFYADLSPEQLSETSKEIKAMINHQRNLRRKAKKEGKV